MTPIPRLQLVSLSVENYRCLKHISLDFDDPMTVLIGKNASGKSTILDVFEFISEASTEIHKAISKRGNSLVDITWARENQLDIALRFSFNVPEHLRETLLNSLGEPSQSIKTMPNGTTVAGDMPKLSTDDLHQSYFLRTLTYEVIIGSTFAEQIKCSGLSKPSVPVNLCSVSGLGSVKLKPEIDSQVWQLSDFSDAESLLGVSVNSSNIPANTPPNLLAQVLSNTQQPSRLLYATMDVLRTYFKTSYHGSPYRKPALLLEVGENRSIDPEGSKLVQVLHTLNNNDRKTFQAIEADLKSLVDEIEFISTPIVQANKTTLEFHQQMDATDDVSFNLRQMSSGTAQLLILLTQLHTAPENSLILLEEVESMLHPSAQAKLTEILMAQSANKTIILSTHSPIIASQSNSKSINLVKKHRGVTIINPYSETLTEEIIAEMGIRPSFSFDSDKAIFVEGEYDEAVYRNWLNKQNLTSLASKGVLIDAQGYTKIQFYANAKLLTRRVVAVETYAAFDGDTREKGDYKQAVQRLNLKQEHILELNARNLESLLADARAIKNAFPSLPMTEAEIESDFAQVGDIDARLKGSLQRVLRTVGGYTAANAVSISNHIQPPDEWLQFFTRINQQK